MVNATEVTENTETTDQKTVKTPILLIGGGGHCASVIDVIQSTQQYHIVGIVEAPGVAQTQFMGVPIIGSDDDLEALLKQTPNCIITVGQLQSAQLRKTLYQKVLAYGGKLATIISPIAHVAVPSEIGAGTVVMHYALVNSLATVGDNCIINSHAIVEHGTAVGAHCHVSTRSTLNGSCRLGHSSLIGSGATVLQGLSIAAESVVGAGALLTKDILQAGTYIGAPAQLLTQPHRTSE